MRSPIAWRNPFRQETPVQKSEREKLEDSVRKSALDLGEIGREIVQDQRYGRMRVEYQRILAQTLRLLIHADMNPTLPDPQAEFVDRIRKYQQQLRALTNLVDVPKDFAAVAERAAVKTPEPVAPGSFKP